eukprot:TRINITY_DN9007_c0_g1_i1.p1 TRINITY_DN9007_c0_g1~~TRINITY_DN9007_c0_g1_i1.p1  ORF type:complete len:1089 (-),score=151.07 TRINITY_DN9007_c0_g1_i1:17-3283(-)
MAFDASKFRFSVEDLSKKTYSHRGPGLQQRVQSFFNVQPATGQEPPLSHGPIVAVHSFAGNQQKSEWVAPVALQPVERSPVPVQDLVARLSGQGYVEQPPTVPMRSSFSAEIEPEQVVHPAALLEPPKPLQTSEQPAAVSSEEARRILDSVRRYEGQQREQFVYQQREEYFRKQNANVVHHIRMKTRGRGGGRGGRRGRGDFYENELPADEEGGGPDGERPAPKPAPKQRQRQKKTEAEEQPKPPGKASLTNQVISPARSCTPPPLVGNSFAPQGVAPPMAILQENKPPPKKTYFLLKPAATEGVRPILPSPVANPPQCIPADQPGRSSFDPPIIGRASPADELLQDVAQDSPPQSKKPGLKQAKQKKERRRSSGTCEEEVEGENVEPKKRTRKKKEQESETHSVQEGATCIVPPDPLSNFSSDQWRDTVFVGDGFAAHRNKVDAQQFVQYLGNSPLPAAIIPVLSAAPYTPLHPGPLPHPQQREAYRSYVTSQLAGVCFVRSSHTKPLVFLLPLRDQAGLLLQSNWELLQNLVAAQDIEKVTFDAFYLFAPLVAVFGSGIQGQRVQDCRTAGWLLDSANPCSDFAALYAHHCSALLPQPLVPMGQEAPTPAMPALAQTPQGVARGAQRLLELWSTLSEGMDHNGLRHAFDSVESRLSVVCAAVHVNGFPVRVEALQSCVQGIQEQLRRLTEEAYKLAGDPINLLSHKECSAVLYDRLKLQTKLPNFVKPTTGEEVLRQLYAHHPLPELIVKYRKYNKLLSAYIVGLQNWVCTESESEDGAWSFRDCPRIHGLLQQHTTATGRMSSAEPNMQNIPKQAVDLGMGEPPVNVRSAFVAPLGYTFAALDYEQIELRVLAHLSNEPFLLEALNSNQDVHTSVASRLHNKPAEAVTPAEREAAKRIVYGIVYGIGAQAISTMTDLSLPQAQQLCQSFRRAFPKLTAYFNAVQTECRMTGHVRTILNRVRHLPDITTPDSSKRSYAERQAVNTVVQGSAADCIKLAMVAVHQFVSEQNALDGGGDPWRPPRLQLISQVHDELIFLVADELVDTYIPEICKMMTSALHLRVTLGVKASVGKSWGELRTWKRPQCT